MLLILALIITTLLLLPSAVVYRLRQHLVGSIETAFVRPCPFNGIILGKTLSKMLVPAIIVLPWVVALVVHVAALMPSSPLLVSLLGVLIILVERILEALLLIIPTFNPYPNLHLQ